MKIVMRMGKAELVRRYTVFLLAMIVGSFGVTLVTRATLGVNSVACFSYVTSVYFPITMGMVNILFNCSMLISQFFVMNAAKRRVQLVNVLLQVPAMVLFGFMLDFWLYVTEDFHPENMPYGYAVCFITFFVGSVIIALNIVLQAIGNVAKLPCDAFVMILAARINKKLGWVKLAFDAFLVITAAIMSLLCSGFSEIIGIREGTVLGALMIGPMIQVLMPYFAFFTRWIDKTKVPAAQSAQ